MMRQTRGRLRVPALMLILGTGLAAAVTVGRGWHSAISIEVIAVVAAAGFYLVGRRDNDIGALYGSRSDERQHMVRLRAQELTAQAMALGCLVGFMVEIARRAPTWPFVVIVGVAVVSFPAGMAIFRERDPFRAAQTTAVTDLRPTPGSPGDGREPGHGARLRRHAERRCRSIIRFQARYYPKPGQAFCALAGDRGRDARLPVEAEARMAEIRRSGMWGSALTADEFAAIHSFGFEPVGQVLGAAVYNIGYTGGYNCPGPFGDGMVSPDRLVTGVSGRGRPGSFGPLVQTLYKARRTAIARMSAECAELGGHGVVGVRLTAGALPAGGQEFKAVGTAVRAPGAGRLRRPFTCDLSGQDFTKLISAGWVPVGLVFGISVGVRHDDRLTRGQTWWSAGNAEVLGYTELANDVRHDARSQLHLDVQRLGAEGVVIADVSLRITERGCPVRENQRDHIAEATIIGTAISRFSRAVRRQGAPSLSILSLDQHRWQAVRMGDSMPRDEASQAAPFAPASPGVSWPLRLRAFTRLKR